MNPLFALCDLTICREHNKIVLVNVEIRFGLAFTFPCFAKTAYRSKQAQSITSTTTTSSTPSTSITLKPKESPLLPSPIRNTYSTISPARSPPSTPSNSSSLKTLNSKISPKTTSLKLCSR